MRIYLDKYNKEMTYFIQINDIFQQLISFVSCNFWENRSTYLNFMLILLGWNVSHKSSHFKRYLVIMVMMEIDTEILILLSF